MKILGDELQGILAQLGEIQKFCSQVMVFARINRVYLFRFSRTTLVSQRYVQVIFKSQRSSATTTYPGHGTHGAHQTISRFQIRGVSQAR